MCSPKNHFGNVTRNITNLFSQMLMQNIDGFELKINNNFTC